MTTQEQFKADYLAAFPDSKRVLLSDDPAAPAIVISPRTALAIWLQQRKRHEAEVAELVKAAKAALSEMCDTNPPRYSFAECIDALDAAIAKFDAPKEKL